MSAATKAMNALKFLSAARAAELVGGAAIELLAGYFGELVTEGLGQGVPDEAHQTAYAEIGLLLHLTSPPARRRWERHRQTLSAELARAYRAPKHCTVSPPTARSGRLGGSSQFARG